MYDDADWLAPMLKNKNPKGNKRFTIRLRRTLDWCTAPWVPSAHKPVDNQGLRSNDYKHEHCASGQHLMYECDCKNLCASGKHSVYDCQCAAAPSRKPDPSGNRKLKHGAPVYFDTNKQIVSYIKFFSDLARGEAVHGIGKESHVFNRPSSDTDSLADSGTSAAHRGSIFASMAHGLPLREFQQEKPLRFVKIEYWVVTEKGTARPVYNRADVLRNQSDLRSQRTAVRQVSQPSGVGIEEFLLRFNTYDQELLRGQEYKDVEGIKRLVPFANIGEPKYPKRAWFELRREEDYAKGRNVRANLLYKIETATDETKAKAQEKFLKYLREHTPASADYLTQHRLAARCNIEDALIHQRTPLEYRDFPKPLSPVKQQYPFGAFCLLKKGSDPLEIHRDDLYETDSVYSVGCRSLDGNNVIETVEVLAKVKGYSQGREQKRLYEITENSMRIGCQAQPWHTVPLRGRAKLNLKELVSIAQIKNFNPSPFIKTFGVCPDVSVVCLCSNCLCTHGTWYAAVQAGLRIPIAFEPYSQEEGSLGKDFFEAPTPVFTLRRKAGVWILRKSWRVQGDSKVRQAELHLGKMGGALSLTKADAEKYCNAQAKAATEEQEWFKWSVKAFALSGKVKGSMAYDWDIQFKHAPPNGPVRNPLEIQRIIARRAAEIENQFPWFKQFLEPEYLPWETDTKKKFWFKTKA